MPWAAEVTSAAVSGRPEGAESLASTPGAVKVAEVSAATV